MIESVRAGAHGYLRKDSTPAELREAIRALHSGQTYFSPALADQMADALLQGATKPRSSRWRRRRTS